MEVRCLLHRIPSRAHKCVATVAGGLFYVGDNSTDAEVNGETVG